MKLVSFYRFPGSKIMTVALKTIYDHPFTMGAGVAAITSKPKNAHKIFISYYSLLNLMSFYKYS